MSSTRSATGSTDSTTPPILLVAGDKAGRWNAWYREAIPLAEQRYELYLKEPTTEEGCRR
jgi:hypothetical protein